MAITKTTLADFSTLARATAIFAIGGAALGAYIGWNTVCSHMPDPAKSYANQYVVGKALHATGLTAFSEVRRSDPAIVFQALQERHPEDAGFIEDGLFKAFFFPWPEVGALAGLGLLVLASGLLEFLLKRTK